MDPGFGQHRGCVDCGIQRRYGMGLRTYQIADRENENLQLARTEQIGGRVDGHQTILQKATTKW